MRYGDGQSTPPLRNFECRLKRPHSGFVRPYHSVVSNAPGMTCAKVLLRHSRRRRHRQMHAVSRRRCLAPVWP